MAWEIWNPHLRYKFIIVSLLRLYCLSKWLLLAITSSLKKWCFDFGSVFFKSFLWSVDRIEAVWYSHNFNNSNFSLYCLLLVGCQCVQSILCTFCFQWGAKAFKNMLIVPPGSGIVHQVNLEYLARVVFSDGETLYPDSLVGTDSHTTMINGLGCVGWGKEIVWPI